MHQKRFLLDLLKSTLSICSMQAAERHRSRWPHGPITVLVTAPRDLGLSTSTPRAAWDGHTQHKAVSNWECFWDIYKTSYTEWETQEYTLNYSGVGFQTIFSGILKQHHIRALKPSQFPFLTIIKESLLENKILFLYTYSEQLHYLIKSHYTGYNVMNILHSSTKTQI